MPPAVLAGVSTWHGQCEGLDGFVLVLAAVFCDDFAVPYVGAAMAGSSCPSPSGLALGIEAVVIPTTSAVALALPVASWRSPMQGSL
ncbi:MAG TPA: hypothetical protein VIK92_09365 [Thermaerobacter sp.]